MAFFVDDPPEGTFCLLEDLPDSAPGDVVLVSDLDVAESWSAGEAVAVDQHVDVTLRPSAEQVGEVDADHVVVEETAPDLRQMLFALHAHQGVKEEVMLCSGVEGRRYVLVDDPERFCDCFREIGRPDDHVDVFACYALLLEDLEELRECGEVGGCQGVCGVFHRSALLSIVLPTVSSRACPWFETSLPPSLKGKKLISTPLKSGSTEVGTVLLYHILSNNSIPERMKMVGASLLVIIFFCFPLLFWWFHGNGGFTGDPNARPKAAAQIVWWRTQIYDMAIPGQGWQFPF